MIGPKGLPMQERPETEEAMSGENQTAMDKDQKDQEEYDKAWEEGGKSDPAPKPEDAPLADEEVEQKPEGDKKPEEKPAEEKKPEAKPETPEVKLEGVQKALHDTKAYATKLAEDNKKLREAIAQQTDSKAIEEAKAAQKTAEENLRKSLDEAYKDYPELKTALDTLSGELKTVKEKLSERDQKEADEKKAADSAREARAAFERDVKPHVVKVHADFDAIVSDPSGKFFKWAESQSPAVKAAVFSSSDPNDINWALTKYKEAEAGGDIARLKEKEAKEKQNNLNLAHTLKGGGANIPATMKKDEKDYDGGWDEAGKVLEKQGVK